MLPCGGQRTAVGVGPFPSILLAASYVRQAGPLTAWFFCLCLPPGGRDWGCRHLHSPSFIKCGSAELNSGSQAHRASVLPSPRTGCLIQYQEMIMFCCRRFCRGESREALVPVCGQLQTPLYNALAGTGKHANRGGKHTLFVEWPEMTMAGAVGVNG